MLVKSSDMEILAYITACSQGIFKYQSGGHLAHQPFKSTHQWLQNGPPVNALLKARFDKTFTLPTEPSVQAMSLHYFFKKDFV